MKEASEKNDEPDAKNNKNKAGDKITNNESAEDEKHAKLNANNHNNSSSLRFWKTYAVVITISCLLYMAAVYFVYLQITEQHTKELLTYSAKLYNSQDEIARLKQDRKQLKGRLKKLETNLTQCTDKVEKLKIRIKSLETAYRQFETENEQCERRNQGLLEKISEMQEYVKKLEQQTDKLSLRLSEAIGDNAVGADDSMSKLEDDSPIKLAEGFKKLYNDDYTVAYEDLEEISSDKSVKALTQQMLNILKLANNLTISYSTSHLKSIKQSLTNLQVDVPAVTTRDNNSECQTTAEEPNTTYCFCLRCGWTDIFMNNTCLKGDRSTMQNVVNETNNSFCLKSQRKEISINRTCFEGDVQPVIVTEDVMISEESLSNKDWKQVYDLRKKVAYKMQDSLFEVLTDVIGRQFDLDLQASPSLLSYIYQCLHICWLINLRTQPLYMKFFDVDNKTAFDMSTFDPFMRSGSYIDYITFPPLYMNEGGNLLVKGVAEGKT